MISLSLIFLMWWVLIPLIGMAGIYLLAHPHHIKNKKDVLE